MEKYKIYVPKATGNEQDINVADLIPIGRENAITRSYLVTLCVEHGLVDEKSRDKDRIMRKLVERARLDYTILNLSNGDGYYRPSIKDIQDLQKYIRQEENRAKSTFRNITNAKALYEDYKHNRIEDD